MHLSVNISPRKVAIVLGSIAILLALQSIYAEYVLSNILGMESDTAPARLLDLFSVNLEESLPTWYSSTNLFVAACLLAWIALGKREQAGSDRRSWAGLALIFLYLSMDEGAAIHESFSGPLQDAFSTSGFLEFGWIILGIPLVILFGTVYFRFWLRLNSPTQPLFAIAGLLYVGGAIGIESISANQYSIDGGSSFLYLAIATLEELCEMLGVVVFIYALLDYLKRHDYMLVVQNQTHIEHLPGVSLRWPYSIGRTVSIFAAFLVLLNGGLLVWGMALRDTENINQAAAYHLYILAEELAGRDVTIAHLSGVFSPASQETRWSVMALFNEFNAVQILSLPGRDATIAFASDMPAFTSAEAIELMAWIDETEYVFYDAPLVKAIIAQP